MLARLRQLERSLCVVALSTLAQPFAVDAGTRITLNSTSSAATAAVAPSLTWSHTITSGSDRFLVVSVASDSGTSVGVDYGGTALELLGRYIAGVHTVEMWGLVAPAVGIADVVVTFSAAHNALAGAKAFNMVNQTTPTGTFQGANGTSSPATTTISSGASELVIDTMITDANSTVTVGADQTEEWRRSAVWDRVGVGSVETGAASVTMSWALSGVVDDWSIGAVALKPVPIAVPVPVSPVASAAGDMNDDGFPDLVVVHPITDRVSISIARGDGSYDPPVYTRVGSSPIAVELGDIDGNGALDAVVASVDGAVHIMRGDGDGGVFHTTSLAASSGASALALLDLGRDGGLDIALADTDAQSIVLLGLDDLGGVTSVSSVDVGSRPWGLAAGDLNGDGFADLVAASPDTSAGIVILVNDLGGVDTQSTVPVGSRPVAVALADLDGDSSLDAVFADNAGHEAIVLLGSGDGEFATPVSFGVGSEPLAVVVAHLDDDCALDVATANAGTNDVSLLLGDGGGGLGSASSFSVAGAPTALRAVNYENGTTDLAVTVPEIDSIVILVSDVLSPAGPRLTLEAEVLGGSCLDIDVELTPSSLAPAAPDHELDFGDGTLPLFLPDLERVVHEYSESGSYTATLTAYDLGTCVARTRRVLELAALQAHSNGPYRLCAGAIDSALAEFDLVGSATANEGQGLTPSYEWDVPGSGFELINGPDGEATLRVPVELAPIAVPIRLHATHDDCVSNVWDLAVLDAAAPVPFPETVDLCAGAGIELDAGAGRASYAWSSGATSREITVSPATDTVYSVVATDPDGCFAEGSTTVRVHALPSPVPTATDLSVCPGQSTVLDAGADYESYDWSTGDDRRNIIVLPTIPTRYELSVVDQLGCGGGGFIDISITADTPVTDSVTGVRVVKHYNAALQFSFSGIDAPGYQLHAAPAPGLLTAAEPIAWSDTNELLLEQPSSGGAYYEVRGASACTRSSGP